MPPKHAVIAYDLDQTVADTEKKVKELVDELYPDKKDLTKEYSLDQILYDQLNYPNILKKCQPHFRKIFAELPVLPFVTEAINKLHQQGYKLIAISSRNEQICPDIEELTKNWLRENVICCDEIYIDIKDKAKCCKEHGVDIFIDDNFKHCTKVGEKTECRVFNIVSPNSKQPIADNAERVYDWQQIYKAITGQALYA